MIKGHFLRILSPLYKQLQEESQRISLDAVDEFPSS